MAIYHIHIQAISRGKGKSCVASSAYRAGEKLNDDKQGLVHDYTNKKGIVHSEIMLPDNAPEKLKDREVLWNEIDRAEDKLNKTRKNSAMTAKEFEIALPRELTKEQRIQAVREYVKNNFSNNGLCADIAMHDKDDGNPHVHIMVNTRAIDIDGEFEKKKSRYIDGDLKEREQLMEQWRGSWEKVCNKELENAGSNERIDHRSYEIRQVEKKPMVHMGKDATQIEKKGGRSKMGDINREIQEQNKRLEELKVELAKLEKEIKFQSEQYELVLQAEEVKLEEEMKMEEELRSEEENKRAEERRKAEQVKAQQQQEQREKQQNQQPIRQPEEQRQWSNEGNRNPDGTVKDMGILDRSQGYLMWVQKEKEGQQQAENIKNSTTKEVLVLQNRIKDLEQRKAEFEKLDKEIEEKERLKGQLGLFKLKEKRHLEKEIADLEKRKKAKILNLKQERGIEPQEIESKIAESQRSLETAKSIQKQVDKQQRSIHEKIKDAQEKHKVHEQQRGQNQDLNKGHER